MSRRCGGNGEEVAKQLKKILYLGWLGFNNVGDELMWELFKEYCGRHWEPGEYELVPSVPGVPYRDIAQYDCVVLGGGSLLIPGYIDLAHRAVQAGKPTLVWGSGYDGLAKPSHAAAHPPYGAAEVDKLTDIARKASFFGVRGPLTHRALRDSGVPIERVFVSGDPGLLLRHERTAERPGDVIGINWGTAYQKIYGGDEARVEAELAAAAKRWIRQGYRICIYSVWGPDREHSRRLAEKIGNPRSVRLENRLLDAKQLMSMIEGFRFTVNFKLHANMISHAAGVPFLCLGYRFKCFDYVQSVDLSNYIVATSETDLSLALEGGAARIETRRAAITAKLARAREAYQDGLERPFRNNDWLWS
jgi:polysaccharide pyruvyl transferase WcaK-like protein